MRFIKVLLLLALFVFSILFFSNNIEILSQSLTLKLDIPLVAVFHSIPLPLGFLILASFVAGSLLTLVYLVVDKYRSCSKLRECKTRRASLEQELNSLRTMPINEDQPYTEIKEDDNA